MEIIKLNHKEQSKTHSSYDGRIEYNWFGWENILIVTDGLVTAVLKYNENNDYGSRWETQGFRVDSLEWLSVKRKNAIGFDMVDNLRQEYNFVIE